MGTCHNLIVQCMDYRIQDTLADWTSARGLRGDLDVISLGGGCKVKDVVLQNIEICCTRHGVTNVYLTQHDDCAAYGGHAAFSSLADERRALVEDMAELRRMVVNRFPQVTVTMLYIEQQDTGWRVVEIP